MKYINPKLIQPLNRSSTAWHRRGYLPHYDKDTIIQFITIRLADSLPQNYLEQVRQDITLSGKNNYTPEQYAKIQDWLDAGLGSCVLKKDEIAQIVISSLNFISISTIQLHEWVIMPNHVHLLLSLLPEQSLAKAMFKLKSFTGSAINRQLNRRGTLWHREYFDRYIRNQAHYDNTCNYIRNNPVAANLCSTAEKWKYSSAALDLAG